MPRSKRAEKTGVTIETPASFRFRTTLLSHGWIQLAPFRHDEAFTELRRVEQLSGGRIVELAFTAGPDESLNVAVEGLSCDPTEEERRQIRAAARRIFNLDVDLERFYAAIGDAERYRWVHQHGGGRLLRAPTVWEDVAKTLLTTNTTWRMTRRMVERLTELGEQGTSGHTFPSPERVAALSFDRLAEQVGAGYRNAYLHALAEDIAGGRIDVESWNDADLPSAELFQRLRALRGFGPYAAGAVLKLLGHYDYLALDSAARSTFASAFNGGERASDKHIERHYAPYGEWRGLVIWMDVMRDWFLDNYPGNSGVGILDS
jgi:3-methyladenine DNA glycosylase/8-oxoguanine DNA glycosylase